MIDYSTVELDGVKAPEWLRITGITFPTLPEITHNETAIPNRYGNFDNGVELGGRDISLSVVIELDGENNIHERTQELKNWLRGDDWQELSKFSFTESGEFYYMARPVGVVSITDLFFAGEGTIDLRSSDGIRYREGLKTVDAEGTEIEVEYLGDEVTPFKMEFTPSDDTEEITVTHNNTGKQVILNGSFNADVPVEVFNDRNLVQVDGQTDMNRVNLTSRWLNLEMGNNLFTIESADSGVEYGISVEYQERY